MPFPEFDPVLLPLGPFAIRWYAIAYIAGIVLGWWYVRRLARNELLWGARAPVASKDQVEDLVLWVTLGVIVGGRLGYMLFYNTEAIWRDPLEIVKIWKGGMSFHGGLIGVVIAFFWVARLHRIDVLKLSDLASPVIPIGLFFGRMANFVNAELWGRETYAPWGVSFCNETIRKYNQGSCPAGEDPRHPSQLYEAGLEGLLLLAILWFAVYRMGLLKRRGAVTGLFLAGYGLFRILVENVREPDEGLAGWPFGLTMGMALSLPMLLAGLYLIWRSYGPKGETAAGFVTLKGAEEDRGTIQAAQAAAVGPGAAMGAAAAKVHSTPKPKPPARPKDPPPAKPPAKKAAPKTASSRKPAAKAKPKPRR